MPGRRVAGLDRVGLGLAASSWLLRWRSRSASRSRSWLAGVPPAGALVVLDDGVERESERRSARWAPGSARGCDRPSRVKDSQGPDAQPARAGARLRRGRHRAAAAAGGLVGVGDRARGGDEPAGLAGSERRARCAPTSPPWAPMPGSRNGVARHQLAQAREVLGLGGAGDGADVLERAGPALAELVDERARAAPTAARRWPARASSRSAAPGLEVRTSTNAPAACSRAAATSGSSASRPEQRVGGEGVGTEAVDGAERATACCRPAPGRRPRR